MLEWHEETKAAAEAAHDTFQREQSDTPAFALDSDGAHYQKLVDGLYEPQGVFATDEHRRQLQGFTD